MSAEQDFETWWRQWTQDAVLELSTREAIAKAAWQAAQETCEERVARNILQTAAKTGIDAAIERDLAREREAALRAQVARLEATLKIIAETPVEKHYSQFHFARNLAQEALAAAQQGGASE